MSMSEENIMSRVDYPCFFSIITRWMDNDVYGHINNVTYYSFFDSAVNRYLIEKGGLDISNAAVVGYVVHSQCNYRKALAYPDALEAGLRVAKLGNSSVTYEIGIFKQDDQEAAAFGEFVHVFVDRSTNEPVRIPEGIRVALQDLLLKP